MRRRKSNINEILYGDDKLTGLLSAKDAINIRKKLREGFKFRV